MWLHEVAVGGLLFSPILTFILAGLLLTWLCYRLLLALGWHQHCGPAPGSIFPCLSAAWP